MIYCGTRMRRALSFYCTDRQGLENLNLGGSTFTASTLAALRARRVSPVPTAADIGRLLILEGRAVLAALLTLEAGGALSVGLVVVIVVVEVVIVAGINGAHDAGHSFLPNN